MEKEQNYTGPIRYIVIKPSHFFSTFTQQIHIIFPFEMFQSSCLQKLPPL